MASAPARAKNVIVMISDGCGFQHVDAASIYRHGETGKLPFHQFPARMAMRTHMAGGGYEPELAWRNFRYVDINPTDSAAASTAMATGVKTYNGSIGMDLDFDPLKNIVETAEELGKATGVITSVEFSHATPAGFVAHDKSRGHYEKIANEMILESAVDIIMGCGHPYYSNNGKKVEEGTFKYIGGEETWKALVEGKAGSDADGDGTPDPWHLIETREDFQKLGQGPTPKRVIGIPRTATTLQQGRAGEKTSDPYVAARVEVVPTLAEMASAALNVLDEDSDGLFLMIEGGAVDWASHGNQSGRMIEEELEFADAVQAVMNWVEANSNWNDTLLIVTGDHQTGYLTGPDSGFPDGAIPVWNPIENRGQGNLPGMEWHSKNHTNSLIPLYAKGAGIDVLKARAEGHVDTRRGPFINNIEIAQTIREIWN